VDAAISRKLLAEIEAAQRELQSGRRMAAVQVYETVRRQKDLDALVQAALGRLCLAMNETYHAAEHFRAALSNDPDNALNLGNLGLALQAEGRIDEAIEAFEHALRGDERVAVVLNGLGVIYLQRGNAEKAEHFLARAVQAKPGDGAINTNYSLALAAASRHDEALQYAEKAARLSPQDPKAQNAYGKILSEMGRIDDAIRHFEKCIRQHRHFGPAYDYLARLKKFAAADRPFMEKAEKVLQSGMSTEDRLCLHFALGKMYDDCAEWDMAFDHYRRANLLKKKEYDIRPQTKLFAQHKKLFTRESLRGFQAMGSDSELPVFVVGMPRSGTTLIERLICSSERSAGAGELDEIPRIARLLSPEDEPRKFSSLLRRNLTRENLEQYAAGYLRVLRRAGPGAERVVDKLPGNYFFIWLISILFPRATIVYVLRHPLDVCLSCYFQNFTNVRWADDLKQIAAVYRFHRQVMDYWQQALPPGKILTVNYEQLVEDPETNGRHLLESCGLEWRGDGLEDYRKEKVVTTASLWQVRQPIYQSSKMRWKNYAPFLGELAIDLADYLQDDRQQLAELGIELPRSGGWKRLFR